MASRGKHEHNFKVLSYSLEPRRSANILLGCVTRPCIETQLVCSLCQEDGNRRRHKTHMKKLAEGDRITLNRAILALTRAAMEYEKLWGPPPKPEDVVPCRIHDEKDWQWSKVAQKHRTCIVCHPGHPESIYEYGERPAYLSS